MVQHIRAILRHGVPLIQVSEPTYAGVLGYVRPFLPYMLWAGQNNVFVFEPHPTRNPGDPRGRWLVNIEDDTGRFPTRQHELFAGWFDRMMKFAQTPHEQHCAIQEFVILQDFFRDGVHLLECGEKTRDAMAQMDLPILASEYHQPFETMGVQMPGAFVIVQWLAHSECLCMASVSGDGTDIFYVRPFPDETFDDAFARVENKRERQNEKYLVGENVGICIETMRIAMNLCLFCTHNGTTTDQSNNAYRTRIEGRLARALKRKDEHLEQVNRTELATIPFKYAIRQTTPLYREIKSTDREGGATTGRTMSPHWRRGHWRRQRYGKGLSETKLIPIPAVLVNSDLFLGDRSGTTTLIKE